MNAATNQIAANPKSIRRLDERAHARTNIHASTIPTSCSSAYMRTWPLQRTLVGSSAKQQCRYDRHEWTAKNSQRQPGQSEHRRCASDDADHSQSKQVVGGMTHGSDYRSEQMERVAPWVYINPEWKPGNAVLDNHLGGQDACGLIDVVRKAQGRDDANQCGHNEHDGDC